MHISQGQLPDQAMPRSISPESSGRASPMPRQWQNHLGGGEPLPKDKAWRRYAAGVEKTLTLFETALEEWADYISFLNKLLKALQAGPASNTIIPHKSLVAKRLSQCLNPTLPSGVHQKTVELYHYVFKTIGRNGLSRDLPLYLPGLSPTLSFASLSVRSPFLELLEHHLLVIDARSLRPAMKSIILALLPGLEDESSEDFDRTLRLVAQFKEAIRPQDSELLTDIHSLGDTFFWQCFFLACVTSTSRRAGALAYLVRNLPMLSGSSGKGSPRGGSGHDETKDRLNEGLSAVVTSPEPGLLVRCFASGLSDDQLLIQRGFLDLLVTHMPLNSTVFQEKVKPTDVELLLKAAVGVVTRRDMSLNRRLWAWLLGPEPPSHEESHQQESSGEIGGHANVNISTRTAFFEAYGLQPLTNALLGMIKEAKTETVNERARPYRICLSLMDRWEIGGLVIPEVFLPVIKSVQDFKEQAASKAEFDEVLRSACVFFDGIESGLIYGEMVSLLAQSISPGDTALEERGRKLGLVAFIISHFNIREEEMVLVHAPLSCLALLSMLEDARSRRGKSTSTWNSTLEEQAISIALTFLELVPERAFLQGETANNDPTLSLDTSNANILKGIRNFYVEEQGNTDAASPPLTTSACGELILKRASSAVQRGNGEGELPEVELGAYIKLLNLALSKTAKHAGFDRIQMIESLRRHLDKQAPLSFTYYTSIVNLCTQLHAADRIDDKDVSQLIPRLVYHAWYYMRPSEPKYHVETARCLWQLQTTLTTSSRDIEAAISTIIVEQSQSADLNKLSDVGRTFGVLWAQTLQDSASDRRGPKPLVSDHRTVSRLSGAEHYGIMLTQPLFLILDALQDERTQLHMAVKSWLSSTLGIDKLFVLLIYQLINVPFLRNLSHNDPNHSPGFGESAARFSEEDDLHLCLYYLRTLNNVLTYAGEVSWMIVGSKHLSLAPDGVQISKSGGEQSDSTMQDFFIQVSMRCVTGELPPSTSAELQERASQLQRSALMILHRFFLSQLSAQLADYRLEDVLLDRLASSIDGTDPYIQALLLDVVYDALRLREGAQLEHPRSPTLDKRSASIDPSRTSRASLSTHDARPTPNTPPPQLLKCLQAGLSKANGRPVLDSWVAFLAHCLPFYAESIFQVLIPLVETLCREAERTFMGLRTVFQGETINSRADAATPDTTLIFLLNGLEQVLARAHDQLLIEESRAQLAKSPDQPQSIFGSMVSGVFQSDNPQSRSATANDRLTVHLAFQDAVRICYKIWSWGQGDEGANQDTTCSASFNYTSLRMRNRARRLLEHLFNAETLECLETVMDIWRGSSATNEPPHVLNFLSSLDASRPKHSIPALFNAMYSRTNPSALDPARISTMTISLQDTDIGAFLVEYARSLDDDAMDEIWLDCITFLKDILSNPFPHRQTLPSLLEFAAILGAKVDNTNFGEQRKMRRELGDLFLKLLAGIFTTRPISFSEHLNSNNTSSEKPTTNDSDLVSILAKVVPDLPKVLLEHDRVLQAANTISVNVISPTVRSKMYPATVSMSTLKLLHELSRVQGNQKTWKRDVGEAFNDSRFFAMDLNLVKDDWLPLLKHWALADKDKVPELVGRVSAPTTAGIVFGVGATSARLEADRKSQLNLRRLALLILASAEDNFVTDLPVISSKFTELLGATPTSSPSSATRADLLLLTRALVLRTSPIHLSLLWPIVNAEIQAALSSVVAPDNSAASELYTNASVLQACKLLDLLICVAPDDFQLHEWLFITDTIDAVYRSSESQHIALVDELSEELGNTSISPVAHMDSDGQLTSANGSRRRPLLSMAGIRDDGAFERRDELVAKVLRPFLGQLSIFAFESVYALGALDREACVQELLKDIFDERSIARAF